MTCTLLNKHVHEMFVMYMSYISSLHISKYAKQTNFALITVHIKCINKTGVKFPSTIYTTLFKNYFDRISLLLPNCYQPDCPNRNWPKPVSTGQTEPATNWSQNHPELVSEPVTPVKTSENWPQNQPELVPEPSKTGLRTSQNWSQNQPEGSQTSWHRCKQKQSRSIGKTLAGTQTQEEQQQQEEIKTLRLLEI
jgi:hypothetical protein